MQIPESGWVWREDHSGVQFERFFYDPRFPMFVEAGNRSYCVGAVFQTDAAALGALAQKLKGDVAAARRQLDHLQQLERRVLDEFGRASGLGRK